MLGQAELFRQAKKDDDAVGIMVKSYNKHRHLVETGQIPPSKWPFMEVRAEIITMQGTRTTNVEEMMNQ